MLQDKLRLLQKGLGIKSEGPTAQRKSAEGEEEEPDSEDEEEDEPGLRRSKKHKRKRKRRKSRDSFLDGDPIAQSKFPIERCL